MFWLEMSRDVQHGGGSWGFTQSLWSPARTRGSRRRWAFWETLLQVRADDSVLHLRGVGAQAAFVGFSVAAQDGYEPAQRPPRPGQWAYADRFYRVLLKDYEPFPVPINLREVFADREDALAGYLRRSKATPRRERERVFYVLQSGRLQCLNGAYLSQVDDELAAILLGPDYSAPDRSQSRPPTIHVSTGERIRELSSRVGQKSFSDAVRSNYGHGCCFPGCGVEHDYFLVGAHIARWADCEDLRGDLSNGVCLCLMHDRAFERGLFTITSDLRIAVNPHTAGGIQSEWCARHVVAYDGQPMRPGATPPSRAALALHWERIGFAPQGQ